MISALALTLTSSPHLSVCLRYLRQVAFARGFLPVYNLSPAASCLNLEFPCARPRLEQSFLPSKARVVVPSSSSF